MQDKGYLKSADKIDMEQENQAIQRAGTIAIVLLTIGVAAGYFLFPMAIEFPVELVERLGFAIMASVFVLFSVLIGVGMVSTARRKSPEDIGGSAAGPPSEKIAIYAAFLQNTLEQSVLAVGLYLALAVLLQGPWLSLIVVSVLFFMVGRVLFFIGYPKGARGRALGMSLTMMPAILGYPLAVVLIIARIF